MKKAYFMLVLAVAFFLHACSTEKQTIKDSQSSTAEDLYFGQKPVGSIPEDLNRNTFATEDWQLGTDFTPGTDELYLTTSGGSPFNPTVVVFRKENRVWKQYKFDATGSDTLYYKDKYIERTTTGWSAIKSLGPEFENIRIMRLTASIKGTLVFDEATRDGNGVLRYSRIVDGKWETPKPLSEEINKGKWSAHPFIAPDESYIIWDSEKEGGHGDNDMYISFKQPDGSWSKAINFGEVINTEAEDGGGYVTPDGKYLSFCPRCDPPFHTKWMDARIIENLKPKE